MNTEHTRLTEGREGKAPWKKRGPYLSGRQWGTVREDYSPNAAWDLAFHTLPFSILDPDFAKDRMKLMLKGACLHPNGRMPACEWNFSNVNPPVRGDNGAGPGASHQTGWTGLVAKTMQLFGLLDAKTALEGGKEAAFTKSPRDTGKEKSVPAAGTPPTRNRK